MLLRKTRAVVTKPSLMADHSSQPSPNQNYAGRTIPSLFGSPKFRDFTTKCLSGTTEALRSPTSILDTTRAISPFGLIWNPFSYDIIRSQTTIPHKISSENRTSLNNNIDPIGIGLALVGTLKDEPVHEKKSSHAPNKGNVLFGTQLRVKIPPLPPPSTLFSSPLESQTCVDHDSHHSPSVVATGILSLSEMELFEEYTCVISHGPNPRTTHIFNNCIVESHFSSPQSSHSRSYSVDNFLSFCYTCKKHLEQTKDIFIYRGEKAFCSPECRHREMVLDGVEN